MKGQIFFPEFGYDSPRKTKHQCSNPAFADPYKHRIGIFAVQYDDDGISGYSVQKRCVNCGKKFGKPHFIVCAKKNFVIQNFDN